MGTVKIRIRFETLVKPRGKNQYLKNCGGNNEILAVLSKY
jgi:hypothetical protein